MTPPPVTVACLFVSGHVNYTPRYVTTLASMVRRDLARPHRFVCLTDRPEALPGIETIAIAPLPRVRAWWNKLRLFDASLGWTGRVLYLDLDVLVVGPLDPFVDLPQSLLLVEHEGDFEGSDGRTVIKRFNSSVIVVDAGTHDRLWTEWTPRVADRLWGDQDWIGERAPAAATFPRAWCPRLSTISGPPFRRDAKVILAKVPKNHIAAQRWPWFREAWV